MTFQLIFSMPEVYSLLAMLLFGLLFPPSETPLLGVASNPPCGVLQDRETQIQAIEGSFEAAKKPVHIFLYFRNSTHILWIQFRKVNYILIHGSVNFIIIMIF